ncbi:sugar transferase [Microbacterium keratanolyticum]
MPADMRSRPYDVLKRALDVLAALIGLILLSPVMLVTAILVAARLGRPVVFAQPRPGKGDRIFTLYKFRSMRSVDESRGWVSDAQRLTPFGRRLRSTSLDELPSLWNVLRGDMSVVGPRPLLVEYLDRYTPAQARRHEVRPGVTGLAQVNGRNALGWEEKFALDVEYVERRSLALDARILWDTVRSVIAREGISQDGQATVEKFGGSHG